MSSLGSRVAGVVEVNGDETTRPFGGATAQAIEAFEALQSTTALEACLEGAPPPGGAILAEVSGRLGPLPSDAERRSGTLPGRTETRTGRWTLVTYHTLSGVAALYECAVPVKKVLPFEDGEPISAGARVMHGDDDPHQLLAGVGSDAAAGAIARRLASAGISAETEALVAVGRVLVSSLAEVTEPRDIGRRVYTRLRVDTHVARFEAGNAAYVRPIDAGLTMLEDHEDPR